jgi:hypothetical protein
LVSPVSLYWSFTIIDEPASDVDETLYPVEQLTPFGRPTVTEVRLIGTLPEHMCPLNVGDGHFSFQDCMNLAGKTHAILVVTEAAYSRWWLEAFMRAEKGTYGRWQLRRKDQAGN